MSTVSEASVHWEQERQSMLSDQDLEDFFDERGQEAELDEDTREYLAWFEADVEDSYRSHMKITSRAVDMDWLSRHELRSSARAGIAPAHKVERAAESKRLVHEVKTAASLGDVADEPSPEVFVTPLEPAPPAEARGGRGAHRPHKRRLSDSTGDGATGAARNRPAGEVHVPQAQNRPAGAAEILASEMPQVSQPQPTPPTALLDPSSAALGRMRRAMYTSTISTVSTNNAEEEEEAREEDEKQGEAGRSCRLAPALPMAGSPANALRRVVRAVMQHRRFAGAV